MKVPQIIIFSLAISSRALCQPTEIDAVIDAQPSESKRLPPHVVYRHFLTWVNQLAKAAATSGSTDPYKFAESFSRAHLQGQHLALIRDEARKLETDLREKDAVAQKIINSYRQEGKFALAQGQPLPPAPPEIHRLQLGVSVA